MQRAALSALFVAASVAATFASAQTTESLAPNVTLVSNATVPFPNDTSVSANVTTTSFAATLDGNATSVDANVTSIADPNATTTTAQPPQSNGVSATATLLSKVLLGASMVALSAFAMA